MDPAIIGAIVAALVFFFLLLFFLRREAMKYPSVLTTNGVGAAEEGRVVMIRDSDGNVVSGRRWYGH